jgi:hypothetical protein
LDLHDRRIEGVQQQHEREQGEHDGDHRKPDRVDVGDAEGLDVVRCGERGAVRKEVGDAAAPKKERDGPLRGTLPNLPDVMAASRMEGLDGSVRRSSRRHRL